MRIFLFLIYYYLFIFYNEIFKKYSKEKFHASDLRKAVVEGDFDSYYNMAAPGTKMLLSSFDGFNRIRTSNENNGRMFHEGKQSIDVVFTMQEKIIPESKVPYLKTYVLVGTRHKDAKDFPNFPTLVGGTIKKFSGFNVITYCALTLFIYRSPHQHVNSDCHL